MLVAGATPASHRGKLAGEQVFEVTAYVLAERHLSGGQLQIHATGQRTPDDASDFPSGHEHLSTEDLPGQREAEVELDQLGAHRQTRVLDRVWQETRDDPIGIGSP